MMILFGLLIMAFFGWVANLQNPPTWLPTALSGAAILCAVWLLI